MKKRLANYAIAAGHELTAATAAEVLKAGGNIFDAAIAAFMTSWISEPCMASAGGGGFATIHQADGHSKIIDFFCQTPALKRHIKEIEFYPVQIDFGTTKETFHIGRGAAAVPGSVAGIFAIHQANGYMPMKDLVQPAIAAALSGVRINAFQHLDFELLKSILRVSERGRAQFFEGDKVKEIGDKVQMPYLADFLEFMATEGPASFYKGTVAKKIGEDQQSNGGYLTMADLEQYKVIQRTPLSFSFQNRQVLTNPQPSKGGEILMDFLKEWESDAALVSSLSWGHLLKLDKIFQKVAIKQMNAQEFKSRSNGLSANEKRGSTTHLSIMDNQGNGISMTVSNGEGCGHFVENTDIQLNNMLGEAALMPDGFHNWKENTRMFSMMTPTVVVSNEKNLEMVIGSGGAGRIPYAIGQVLINQIHFKQALFKAVNNPRAHLQEGIFNIEPGYNFEDSNLPNSFKKWLEKSLFFGGVHTVLWKEGVLEAVGDTRRDGVAEKL